MLLVLHFAELENEVDEGDSVGGGVVGASALPVALGAFGAISNSEYWLYVMQGTLLHRY